MDSRSCSFPFVLCALLVAGLAILANEWTLSFASADGSLQHQTRVLIRISQAAGLGLAAGLFFARNRLPRLFRDDRRAMAVLLVLGLALRVAVFPFLGPDNNDPHREMVEYVAEHGWTPTADEATLGFQPPLYYLMAAPFALGGSAKWIQVLSLLCSLANLVLLHRLLRGTLLLEDPRARTHAFALAALLPQFVLFGLFVSNDTLAFLVGTLVFGQFLAFSERPSLGRTLGLGVALGVGLLTKGTFTAFVPVALLLAALIWWRSGERLPKIARSLVLLGATTALVGCYKFVENYVHFGTPVVNNDILEQPWVARQQGTVQGVSSFVDVDVPRLVRYPYLSDETKHSLPLLFYGTFWYSHIPESNFDHTRRHPFTLVPRSVYVTALVPTALMLVGLFAWAARGFALFGKLRRAPKDRDRDWNPDGGGGLDVEVRKDLVSSAIVGVLLLNFGTVLTWGLKHDAWSFFQSRLMFPSFLALALLLGYGFESTVRRFPRLAAVGNLALVAPWLTGLAWLAIEIAGEL